MFCEDVAELENAIGSNIRKANCGNERTSRVILIAEIIIIIHFESILNNIEKLRILSANFVPFS